VVLLGVVSAGSKTAPREGGQEGNGTKISLSPMQRPTLPAELSLFLGMPVLDNFSTSFLPWLGQQWEWLGAAFDCSRLDASTS